MEDLGSRDSISKILLTLKYTSVVAASVIRLSGSLYQAITGKIDKGCLEVVDGKLVQTPFTSGGQCMRTFEYGFIVFNFLPVAVLIVMFMSNVV